MEVNRELLQQALGLLKQATGINATEEMLAKLNLEDPYEEELIVMAETSAYFRVAYKVRVFRLLLQSYSHHLQRVIDNIPRVIDHGFMRAVADGLYDALVTGLSLETDKATERASFFLAEDRQVTAERRHLLQKKNRLDAALK